MTPNQRSQKHIGPFTLSTQLMFSSFPQQWLGTFLFDFKTTFSSHILGGQRMLKSNTASSNWGNSCTVTASPNVFMLVVVVPCAQYSASLTETSGHRSDGDQDFKFKHPYSSSKYSLKTLQSLYFPVINWFCCCCLKSESPEGKIDVVCVFWHELAVFQQPEKGVNMP